MKVDIECRYCGYRRIIDVWSKLSLQDERCIQCNDKNFFIRNPESPKVDYYKDDPKFEKEYPKDYDETKEVEIDDYDEYI